MTTILALPLLFADVQAQLAADASTANVVFGWRERTKTRINQGPGGANRVVFEPGEEKGKAGEYAPPVKTRGVWGTRSLRSLGTFLETCTIECWAYDPDDQSELAQYTAARHLHDHVIRAIYLSPRVGHGSFEVKDPMWIVDKKELRFGAAIKFTLIIQAKIVDDPGPPRDLDIEAVQPEHAIGPAVIALPAGDETDGTDTTPIP